MKIADRYDDDALLPERVELQLRQLPGVIGVNLDDRTGTLRLQLLVADARRADVVVEDAHRVVADTVDWPVVVDTVLPPLPVAPLHWEREVSELPGVRSLVVHRGARGEVRSVEIAVEDAAATAAVRDRLTAAHGPLFVDRHLVVLTD